MSITNTTFRPMDSIYKRWGWFSVFTFLALLGIAWGTGLWLLHAFIALSILPIIVGENLAKNV